MLCFVVQGALAGAIGHAHAHDAHPHHTHHSHAHAVHAHASADAAAADLGDDTQPDSGAKADFDWTCCGSTACTAVLLTTAAPLATCSAEDSVVAGLRSQPVFGFVGDGPRRPPRSSVLA
jgi:hypothetical protein